MNFFQEFLPLMFIIFCFFVLKNGGFMKFINFLQEILVSIFVMFVGFGWFIAVIVIFFKYPFGNAFKINLVITMLYLGFIIIMRLIRNWFKKKLGIKE